MSTKTKAPTMKDVAREAGVALGTVSKVFNGIPVGDEYRQKVEEAAKRLGYQVNVYARGLRASRTFTIALIVPVINHPFFSELADNCCEILQKKGYRLMITTTYYDPDTEQKCIDMVQQNKVDGIIAITYNPNLEVSDDLPFVIIDRKLEANIPCVSSDNFAGGEIAAQKLLENGCKKLLFLSTGSAVPGEADKRLIGFESYCMQHDVSYAKFKTFDNEGTAPLLKYIEDHTHDGAFDYDGIFCNTDVIANMALEKLKALGLSVPDDVQIIGYDGVKKQGTDDYLCSTIKQPIYKMAETAINLLLDTDKSGSPALVCLPVEYCYGGTTKK